jgi:hypothetical protein
MCKMIFSTLQIYEIKLKNNEVKIKNIKNMRLISLMHVYIYVFCWCLLCKVRGFKLLCCIIMWIG